MMLKVLFITVLVLAATQATKHKKRALQERKPGFIAKRQVGSCRADQYKCADGSRCIDQRWQCDGDDDCADASDELSCASVKTCVANQFMCVSGECIPMEWACDTQRDCPDGSDEAECRCDCLGPNQFKCHNGQCVPRSSVCDAIDNCGDFSDETDCQCNSTTHFTCSSGRCIPIDWRCDGDNDCNDLSDEVGCPTLHPSLCSDMMSTRGCLLMNETSDPICWQTEVGYKYCRKFCNLCFTGTEQ
ncbi:hypothetical protein C0Q70_14853 [Pomacea canaliculata]|uniref:Uncharacterized protein n=1 Tax=Pomacea canaliculata TaxID=400727 RepID=A0A2T7NT79_POMCA|nr:hypothetical protein C0Q70_14853 [Pomacea canaliculata]